MTIAPQADRAGLAKRGAGPVGRRGGQLIDRVFRTDDGGATWKSANKGTRAEPETIYVIPLMGAEFRCPPSGKLRVFRSRNGGKSWRGLTKGLPKDKSFVGIYREGMAMDSLDPAGVYFGTNTGKMFASRDEGDAWYLLADNLPPVYSVATAQL